VVGGFRNRGRRRLGSRASSSFENPRKIVQRGRQSIPGHGRRFGFRPRIGARPPQSAEYVLFHGVLNGRRQIPKDQQPDADQQSEPAQESDQRLHERNGQQHQQREQDMPDFQRRTLHQR
jgi:hypothetical protein